jgi:hypothetical protein
MKKERTEENCVIKEIHKSYFSVRYNQGEKIKEDGLNGACGN